MDGRRKDRVLLHASGDLAVLHELTEDDFVHHQVLNRPDRRPGRHAGVNRQLEDPAEHRVVAVLAVLTTGTLLIVRSGWVFIGSGTVAIR